MLTSTCKRQDSSGCERTAQLRSVQVTSLQHAALVCIVCGAKAAIAAARQCSLPRIRHGHAVRGRDLEASQSGKRHASLHLRLELDEGDPRLGFHHTHLGVPSSARRVSAQRGGATRRRARTPETAGTAWRAWSWSSPPAAPPQTKSCLAAPRPPLPLLQRLRRRRPRRPALRSARARRERAELRTRRGERTRGAPPTLAHAPAPCTALARLSGGSHVPSAFATTSDLPCAKARRCTPAQRREQAQGEQRDAWPGAPVVCRKS